MSPYSLDMIHLSLDFLLINPKLVGKKVKNHL